MKKLVPRYIPVGQISIQPVTHTWDDWDPFEALSEPEARTKQKLRETSNRAISVFALGCAEWVIYRLGCHFSDNLPYDYLDAFWCFLQAGTDSAPPPTDDEEWQGVIRGPINLALMTVLNTIYLAEDGAPTQNGALAPQIVRHVIGPDDLFSKWEATVLDRLCAACPRVETDPDGIPLPRVLLDPEIAIHHLDFADAVRHDLSRLNRGSNRFLRGA